VLGVKYSPAPVFDLHEEFELQQLVRQLTKKKWLRSLHNVSEGGLFTNLMESAVSSGLGFNVETMDTFRKDCFLFGESQSRVVLTMPPDREDEFQTFLVSNNVSFTKLGEVFGTEVVIDDENFGSVAEWKSISDNTLGENFEN
jgi:phosphoribosylformylglycinamidine synthase